MKTWALFSLLAPSAYAVMLSMNRKFAALDEPFPMDLRFVCQTNGEGIGISCQQISRQGLGRLGRRESQEIMQAIDPQLARINLESNSCRQPVWVGFLSFLEFSHEISEDLADLVAKYEPTSHRSSFSFSRPIMATTRPAKV